MYLKHPNCRDCIIYMPWRLWIPEKGGYRVKFYWINARTMGVLTPVIRDFFTDEYMKQWKTYKSV